MQRTLKICCLFIWMQLSFLISENKILGQFAESVVVIPVIIARFSLMVCSPCLFCSHGINKPVLNIHLC